MMIMMIRVRTVMITIIVASSASPIGPNATIEMYISKKEMMMTIMKMMIRVMLMMNDH